MCVLLRLLASADGMCVRVCVNIEVRFLAVSGGMPKIQNNVQILQCWLLSILTG